nr:hypothetical protein Itr_chr04CG02040 [Ipomoea trifida]
MIAGGRLIWLAGAAVDAQAKVELRRGREFVEVEFQGCAARDNDAIGGCAAAASAAAEFAFVVAAFMAAQSLAGREGFVADGALVRLAARVQSTRRRDGG